VRQAFTLKTPPGKGGVYDGEMSTPLKLASQLKVMKDTENSLNNSHEEAGGPSTLRITKSGSAAING
jgi:hypothetical protein